MIINQTLIDQSKPGSGQEPTNIPRRALIGGAGALVALLASPVQAMAKKPSDSFVLLLKGLYEPVVHAPNLGLSVVDLNDGSYSKTKIYPVSGIPGHTKPDKTIGDFYVQLGGELCAYHVPGGSFAMRFIGSDFIFVDDGFGGRFLEGTFELRARYETSGPDPIAFSNGWEGSCSSSPRERDQGAGGQPPGRRD